MKWYQMRWAQKYWGKAARERYRRYLQSDAWKTKRKAVLQAAGFRCRRCGAPATEVHHETYKRIYNERMSDLTALCSACHQAAHSGKKQRRKEDSPQKRRYRNPKQRRSSRKRMSKARGASKHTERRTPLDALTVAKELRLGYSHSTNGRRRSTALHASYRL